MPIQLDEENGGKILVVHVSGKLTKADYEHLVPEFQRLVREHGKLRVLYDMTDFHGWDLGALWEGTVFKIKHSADTERIERCAIVGEKTWQQDMATFCKPFTKAMIRYFDHADAAEARKWFGEASGLRPRLARVNAPHQYRQRSRLAGKSAPGRVEIADRSPRKPMSDSTISASWPGRWAGLGATYG